MQDIIEVPDWEDTMGNARKERRQPQVAASTHKRRAMERQAQRNYKLRCWLAVPTLLALAVFCYTIVQPSVDHARAAACVLAMLPWVVLYIGRPSID